MRASLRERLSIGGLVALMGGSGILHFVSPEPYEQIVPSWVPSAEAAVFWSGVAELLVAAGLLHPRTRRAAALANIALLLAIFPANIQHALDAPASTGLWWGTRARLPLQPVFIWWSWRIAQRARTVVAE